MAVPKGTWKGGVGFQSPRLLSDLGLPHQYCPSSPTCVLGLLLSSQHLRVAASLSHTSTTDGFPDGLTLLASGLGKHVAMAPQEYIIMGSDSVGIVGVTEAGGTLGDNFLP